MLVQEKLRASCNQNLELEILELGFARPDE
jgi:hypothetical protein